MAVAAEYKFNNATVRILDDEIRDVPEAEMARRIRDAQRAAWRIWYEQHRREREKDPSTPLRCAQDDKEEKGQRTT